MDASGDTTGDATGQGTPSQAYHDAADQRTSAASSAPQGDISRLAPYYPTKPEPAVDVRPGNVSRSDTPPPESAGSAEGRISAEAQAADRQQPVELPAPVSNLAAAVARLSALHFLSGSPDWAPLEIAAIATTDVTPRDDSTLEEGASDADSRSRTLGLSNLAPQAGQLLAGIVPFDVPALERGLRSFFRRVENLGGDLSDSEWMTRLVPWVTGVSAAIVAYEFACRHRERAVRDWAATGAGDSVTWTWLSGTALLPPEDER